MMVIHMESLLTVLISMDTKHFHTQPSPRKSVFPMHYRFIYSVLILFDYLAMTTSASHMNIGVLLDNKTRIGREMRTAIRVAARNFEVSFREDEAFLHFLDPGESPLQAVNAAEILVKKKNVQSIIGTSTWEETALVASIGNQAKVPIISFAGSAIETPITRKQWPFLLQMAPDIKLQIKCIADIVGSFGWRKVIVIYEVDSHGNDSGAFAQLSDALGGLGVEIEHRLVLPSPSSLPDPKSFVHDEVVNLLSKQTRVFVVLKTSLTLGVHLFKEAKKLNLFQVDCAWIVSDPLAGLLDSVDSSTASSMEGALGVTTYFNESSTSFIKFKQQFKKNFLLDYPEEDSSEPSIYALRAFDTFTALTSAIRKLNVASASATLLEGLLSTNFTGLSGLISFRDGGLLQPSVLKVVNFSRKKAKKVGVWSSEHGFSESVDTEGSRGKPGAEKLEEWFDSVTWPGNLKRIPKGWSMPNEAYRFKIGVPGRTAFEKFVKVNWSAIDDERSYSGFCIEVFYEVRDILEQRYHFPYEFIPFNGSYDELVHCVVNKTFDAVIGDVTILSSRAREVEFTQPFTESWLTMVVTVKSKAQNKAWIFVQPFTGKMWAVTGGIFLYTVLIVWILEREDNPEFDGHWWSQLSTALWFTSTSLFFSQRERIYSNYARMVMVVWLFVVLVLSSSYTASLSSLLTVPQLVPNVTDIEWLKANNAKIGCDGDSFVRKYLGDVLGFQPDNIRNISSEYDYPKEFESGSITAAFLELPYQKAFFSHFCVGYTVTRNSSTVSRDRFGGFGFVLPKGSPIAHDMSEAILSLAETGTLKTLEDEYFSPAGKCSLSSDNADKLDWLSFWGLFLFSAGNSTICCLLFFVPRLYSWGCGARDELLSLVRFHFNFSFMKPN